MAAGEATKPTLRPARPDDAADLARLVDLAGEGLPRHVWSGMAGPGQDVWEVGTARAAREQGAFSWRNAAIAELEGRVAGALVTYRIGGAPEPLDGLPPIVRPLQALENRALGTQYVNVLATYPGFRRRGVATALLAEAEARAAGAPGLSLIVADTNAAARRIYEATGYLERARLPAIFEGDWAPAITGWVLMIKPLALAERGDFG